MQFIFLVPAFGWYFKDQTFPHLLAREKYEVGMNEVLEGINLESP